MIKKTILIGFVLLSNLVMSQTDSTNTESQKDTSWTTGGLFNLNFSNVTLKNWAGGGESSVAFGSKFIYFANYEKGKTTWDNSIDLAYGITRLGDSDQEFKKTDDQIILISKFGHQLSKHWFASALIDFRSQIANGFLYSPDTNDLSKETATLTSRFLSPAYALTSVGAEYRFKKIFSAFLSPATGKTTIVLDEDISNAGLYGVEAGENIRNEFGALVKLNFKKEIVKNVTFLTDMNFFTAYDNSFGTIDVNLIATIDFKINDFLSAMYSINLVYDEDVDLVRDDGTVGPATQYKDVLNIGLVYKFK